MQLDLFAVELQEILQEALYVLIDFVTKLAGAIGLYFTLFYLLRSLFRKFERDIALVTLNVSSSPILAIFVLISFKITIQNTVSLATVAWLDRLFIGGIIITISYWSLQLFKQVLVYYLKEYAAITEVMWDDVLIPLLEGVIPAVIVLVGGSAVLQLCFGLDLTGAWLTLGGGAFVIGFAVKDILANFFSGIVLLLDSPFQFGDVLRIETESGTQLGILRKIGVRVTRFYMFETHTEVYIPNSVMQSQRITNLSRPIEPVYFFTTIELTPKCDLEQARQVMQEIIQAHPDTLGDIDTKLDCLERYYDWTDVADDFVAKKENGKKRLLAENAVNEKLEEIEQSLEALIITLQFVEEGGLTQDEIETVQQEFNDVLELIGLTVLHQSVRRRSSFFKLKQVPASFNLEETQDADSLIRLVRQWYRMWLRDPNVVDQDEYVLPEIWEHKIKLLKRRVQKLHQKILNPLQEETRLDDYVKRLVEWLRDRFKQARSQWQEPQVRMEGVVHYEGYTYIQFVLNYYVDDIRLEDGARGIRVNSDIHREIMRHLKEDCQSRGV
ncbi:MAG: mechanosensitive ion channel family protein [Symploca sp. SIO1C2]|nr:mechanosensitive ion channel family protein [Symploca sp. SIO1C2]